MSPAFLFTIFLAMIPLGCGLVPAASSAFEFWFTRFCFAVGGLALCLAFVSWLLKERDKPAASGGRMILYGIATLLTAPTCIGGGLWWVEIKQAAWSLPNLDNSIALRCFPFVSPVKQSENPSYMLQIQRPHGPNDFGMLSDRTDMLDLGKSNHQIDFECKIRNLGRQSVYDLRASFELRWNVAVKLEHGFSEGHIITSSSVTTPALALGTGESGEVDLYFISMNTDFTTVFPPETVQLRVIGGSDVHTVKLIPPDLPPGSIFFGPNPGLIGRVVESPGAEIPAAEMSPQTLPSSH